MNKQRIGQTDIEASRIALGCMRLSSLTSTEASRLLETAFDQGIDFIDHADIYGGGESEIRFSQAMKSIKLSRDQYILQSKCGIKDGIYDFSKEHIVSSVDGILKRLGTDYLDFLVLHRPDALMEPEEIAEAFSQLEKAGKVRYFGVSNQNPYQMQLLQASLEQKLAINQMQLSPAHTPMLDAGFNVNMRNQAAINRDNGVLEYCQLHKMTVQAWSPFQIDLDKGLFRGNPDYHQLDETLDALGQKYGVAAEAIIIAWILRHPAKIQAIVGSMNPERLIKIAQASTFNLTRSEWYAIYLSAGNSIP
ncbi:aldo/keto reductase [Streptococcus didelphis]|uniref:Aldo/keto reductase n=1 Tax=Streptococcus didelphis TaxID=102886 RepID=A0ABY9LIK1_9STRE|nr:aldo/keto reductase [Streptococcus didelphis]WMB28700.1 aldo/keto reductase [Streptococcus didelphis]WMB29356.1 aldo/keto reductase [Streptococcus didelphis]